MKARLNKVKQTTKSPTEALNESSETMEPDPVPNKRNKRLSELIDDKPKVEESHSRRTFLVENELLEELDAIAENKKRGFITSFINYAIENALNDYKNIK